LEVDVLRTTTFQSLRKYKKQHPATAAAIIVTGNQACDGCMGPLATVSHALDNVPVTHNHHSYRACDRSHHPQYQVWGQQQCKVAHAPSVSRRTWSKTLASTGRMGCRSVPGGMNCNVTKSCRELGGRNGHTCRLQAPVDTCRGRITVAA
jgi:hypothetical protein